MDPTDEATTPEERFDELLAIAGAAIELNGNMSAFTHMLLFKAEQACRKADIPESDERFRNLRSLLELWSEDVTPAFTRAVQKDPTGPRGEQALRPWRHPEFAGSTS